MDVVAVISVRIFTANTVLLRPVWYAACVIGILDIIFSDIRLIIMMASILLRSESKMIGLKYDGKPAFLPGFCSGGVSCPNSLSSTYVAEFSTYMFSNFTLDVMLNTVWVIL